MLTLRATLRRHSIARKRQIARCSSCSLVPSNQPSLEMLIRKSDGRLAVAAAVRPRQLRVGVLVANEDAEGVMLVRGGIVEPESREFLPGPNAVIEIVGGEGVHPRQPIAQRHIFAEGDAMHLVVASADLPVALDQDGRVVAARRPSSSRLAEFMPTSTLLRQRAAMPCRAISTGRAAGRACRRLLRYPFVRLTCFRPDDQVGPIMGGEIGQVDEVAGHCAERLPRRRRCHCGCVDRGCPERERCAVPASDAPVPDARSRKPSCRSARPGRRVPARANRSGPSAARRPAPVSQARNQRRLQRISNSKALTAAMRKLTP